MARRVLLIDDFDGITSEGVKTVTFSVDGERWTIDLGKESLDALKDAVKPFVKKATKVPTTGNYKKGTRPGVRQWAEAQGLIEPGGKGRLSREVNEAYDAAH